MAAMPSGPKETPMLRNLAQFLAELLHAALAALCPCGTCQVTR